MLMVIFGAGASYDSWSSFPPEQKPRTSDIFRPPLAKELFLPYEPYREKSEVYIRCQPLIPFLESRDNVEEILERFSIEAEQDIERRRQLLALQFYIRGIIVACQESWLRTTHRMTNFRTLLDQVPRLPEVCFVTFNYDLMLENALHAIDVQFPDIGSYVSVTKFNLFKLHGSIDWITWRSAQNTNVRSANQPSEADLIRAAPRPGGGGLITKGGARPPQNIVQELYHYYPALAIPTLSKSGFVCPAEHVEVLEKSIPKIDKIAIVGWRAGERNFLDMLAKGLPSGVEVIAACGNEQAAKDTLGNIENAGIRVRKSTAEPGGFTEFVLNRRIESFLGRNP